MLTELCNEARRMSLDFAVLNTVLLNGHQNTNFNQKMVFCTYATSLNLSIMDLKEYLFLIEIIEQSETVA